MEYGEHTEILIFVSEQVKKLENRIDDLERELYCTNYQLSEAYNLINDLQEYQNTINNKEVSL